MPKKSKEEQPKKQPIRAFFGTLDRMYPDQPVYPPVVSLERLYAQEQAEQERELITLEIEREKVRKQKQIADMKQGLTSPPQAPQSNVSMEFLKLMLEDPEMQKQWVEAPLESKMMMMQMFSGSSGSPQGMTNLAVMLPMLMNYMKQNPGTDLKSMIEIVRMVTPPTQNQITLTGIADLIKALNQGTQTQSPTDLYSRLVDPLMSEVKAMREAFTQQTIGTLSKKIDELENRPSDFDTLAAAKDKILAIRDAFGGGGVSDEMRKLQLENQRYFFDTTTRIQQEQAAREADDQFKNQILSVAKDAMKGPIGKAVAGIGTAAAAKINPREQPPQELPQGFVQTQCAVCHKPFALPADAKMVICPHCKNQLSVGPQEPVEKKEKPRQMSENVEAQTESEAEAKPESDSGVEGGSEE